MCAQHGRPLLREKGPQRPEQLWRAGGAGSGKVTQIQSGAP